MKGKKGDFFEEDSYKDRRVCKYCDSTIEFNEKNMTILYKYREFISWHDETCIVICPFCKKHIELYPPGIVQDRILHNKNERWIKFNCKCKKGAYIKDNDIKLSKYLRLYSGKCVNCNEEIFFKTNSRKIPQDLKIRLEQPPNICILL